MTSAILEPGISAMNAMSGIILALTSSMRWWAPH
jgi:hypothetical protein